MTRIDPPIRWAVGQPRRTHYGERVDRLEIFNSHFATGRDRSYIEHLLCRLEPLGTFILTGRKDHTLTPGGFTE